MWEKKILKNDIWLKKVKRKINFERQTTIEQRNLGENIPEILFGLKNQGASIEMKRTYFK